MSRINQRLNGLDPLAYIGVDAYEPTDFIKKNRNPLSTDSNNFSLGTWWLNTVTNSLFMLVSLDDNVATWKDLSENSGAVDTLTGDTGGPVGETAGNINVVGDGITMTIAGNPGTNTLTISAILPTPFETLTGDSGGPVSPTEGNINIIGAEGIEVVGSPGTSTLTINPSPINAISFVTQSGTATPSAGALTIDGSSGLTTSGSGNTVTIASDGSLTTSYITSPATGTAVPAAGVITFSAGANTTLSASGSTVTVNNTGASVSSPSYSTGSFSPTFTIGGSGAGIIYSTQLGAYLRIGNIVFLNMLIETSFLPAQGLIGVASLPFVAARADESCSFVLNNPITGVGNTKYNYNWLFYDTGLLAWTAKASVDGTGNINLPSSNSGNNLSASTSMFYFV